MSNGEQRGTSRSGFLKQAAGATMVVAGAGVGAGVLAQEAAAASSTVNNRFSLEIDGVNCGGIASVSGGVPEFEVIDGPVGSDNYRTQALGQVKIASCRIQIGSGMDLPMYRWIMDSIDTGYVRKSGAIISADFNYNEKSRREFTNALITEVTFPALDGASKDPAYLTVTFSPTSMASVPGSGAPVHAANQKAWLPGNFRLIVQGLDTTRVASIDSFTWKQSIQADGSVVLDAGDLGVSFPLASLPSWQGWYDNFAVGGDATDERNAILELVGQDGTVLDLSLFNLGLFHLDPDDGKGIRRVKGEMYVTKPRFDLIDSRGHKVRA